LISHNNLTISNNSSNKNSNDISRNNKDIVEIKSTELFNSKNLNFSSYNMTEYLQKIKNEKKNKENNLFINSSSIINFQYEKFIFEMSFIKKNCNEILNLFKEKKIRKKIFIEKIKKIKEISDMNSLEEREENFLKEIFSIILIKYRIHLNREITDISHCNVKSFSYFMNKNICKGKEEMIHFNNKIDYFPILEIESNKYDREQKTFEDGILHIVFLLFKDHESLIEVYSRIKYEVYYSENALCNYLCKYVYELIYEYSNVSETFLDFFKKFGFIENDKNNLKEKDKDNIINDKKSQEDNHIRKFSSENLLTFNPLIVHSLNNNNLTRNMDKDKEDKDQYKDKNKNNDLNSNISIDKIEIKFDLKNTNSQDFNKNKKHNLIGFIGNNNNNEIENNKNNSICFSDDISKMNLNSSYTTKVVNLSEEEESLRKKDNSINLAVEENTSYLPLLKRYIKNKNNNDDKNQKSKKIETRIDINYPFKKITENLENLINLKLIKYLLKNIPYMKGNYDLESIPFNKFMKLFMKFNTFFLNQDGLKMKHSFLRKAEYEHFKIFKEFLIFDDSDRITKDHKVNLDKIIFFMLNYMEKEFKGLKSNEEDTKSKSSSNKINNFVKLKNDKDISLIENHIDNKNNLIITKSNDEGKNNYLTNRNLI
jgi:hypothetical protein